eukprot:Gb_38274 [translate_table: standard]
MWLPLSAVLPPNPHGSTSCSDFTVLARPSLLDPFLDLNFPQAWLPLSTVPPLNSLSLLFLHSLLVVCFSSSLPSSGAYCSLQSTSFQTSFSLLGCCSALSSHSRLLLLFPLSLPSFFFLPFLFSFPELIAPCSSSSCRPVHCSSRAAPCSSLICHSSFLLNYLPLKPSPFGLFVVLGDECLTMLAAHFSFGLFTRRAVNAPHDSLTIFPHFYGLFAVLSGECFTPFLPFSPLHFLWPVRRTPLGRLLLDQVVRRSLSACPICDARLPKLI